MVTDAEPNYSLSPIDSDSENFRCIVSRYILSRSPAVFRLLARRALASVSIAGGGDSYGWERQELTKRPHSETVSTAGMRSIAASDATTCPLAPVASAISAMAFEQC